MPYASKHMQFEADMLRLRLAYQSAYENNEAQRQDDLAREIVELQEKYFGLH
jgi:hypothetical protein